MAKQFSRASKDVLTRIERLVGKHYPELDGVTISALFVFNDDSDPVLTHQGYPAAAMARIVSTRERAAGLEDAMIVIDRATYSGLTTKQCDALLDHELYHITRVIDEKTEQPKADVLGRPKLTIRKHDWQLGWFDEIVQRHGEHSMEVRQARELMEGSGQLYFDFAQDEAA